MTNEEFIRLHRGEDTSALALKRAPEGVDLKFCLEQIKSRQKAERKLPRWAAVEGLLFPPALSMEQCSSQETAHYKQRLVERILPPPERNAMVDLTAGFGVDFSYLAMLFKQAVYVEQQANLCEIAHHNMPLLGLGHAEIRCVRCEEYLLESGCADLIFMDPARRDGAGRKTVLLEDCTPCVTTMLADLLGRCRYLLLKLSPMLDIHAALKTLKNVCEVHVVSVDGECRELLLLLDARGCRQVSFHCVNLGRKPNCFVVEDMSHVVSVAVDGPSAYLYEPNASVLKAGVQDALCDRFGVEKLHRNSNLFTSVQLVEDFPGRAFCVRSCFDFSKQSLKALLLQVRKANLTVRNFPSTVDQLRKRLKLKEGGDVYLFATTLADESHVLVQCEKAE